MAGISPRRLAANVGAKRLARLVPAIRDVLARAIEAGGSSLRDFADSDGKLGYFSVTDSGIGIDAQHISRLTERFYRVDSGRSRETGGTGLGLAIVKHVLMQHDARLDIHSIPNKGSTFTAVFPANRLA